MYIVNRVICNMTKGQVRDRIENSSEVESNKDKILQTFSFSVLYELSQVWDMLGAKSPFSKYECVTEIINLNEIKDYDKIDFKYGEILNLELYYDEFICEFLYEGDPDLDKVSPTTTIIKIDLSILEGKWQRS